MLTAIADTLERSGVEVVGRAADGQVALAQIEAHQPQVALVDIRMPRLSGIEVATKAGVVAPNTSIIFYTAYGDRALLSEALDVGARGFVLKEAPLPDLVRAVERVAAGDAYVDPVLAGVLVSAQSEKVPTLTQREREVLRLLAADNRTRRSASGSSSRPKPCAPTSARRWRSSPPTRVRRQSRLRCASL